jgi:hypothetical protein
MEEIYEYHHMGIPTTESRPGEVYIPKFKMWISGYEDSEFKVQWHRYEEGCELPLLIQTVAHPAFKVKDMEQALKGKKVILQPYYPLDDFLVAFIEDGGAPIEFIQTDLTEEEIIERAKKNRA